MQNIFFLLLLLGFSAQAQTELIPSKEIDLSALGMDVVFDMQTHQEKLYIIGTDQTTRIDGSWANDIYTSKLLIFNSMLQLEKEYAFPQIKLINIRINPNDEIYITSNTFNNEAIQSYLYQSTTENIEFNIDTLNESGGFLDFVLIPNSDSKLYHFIRNDSQFVALDNYSSFHEQFIVRSTNTFIKPTLFSNSPSETYNSMLVTSDSIYVFHYTELSENISISVLDLNTLDKIQEINFRDYLCPLTEFGNEGIISPFHLSKDYNCNIYLSGLALCNLYADDVLYEDVFIKQISRFEYPYNYLHTYDDFNDCLNISDEESVTFGTFFPSNAFSSNEYQLFIGYSNFYNDSTSTWFKYYLYNSENNLETIHRRKNEMNQDILFTNSFMGNYIEMSSNGWQITLRYFEDFYLGQKMVNCDFVLGNNEKDAAPIFNYELSNNQLVIQSSKKIKNISTYTICGQRINDSFKNRSSVSFPKEISGLFYAKIEWQNDSSITFPFYKQ